MGWTLSMPFSFLL